MRYVLQQHPVKEHTNDNMGDTLLQGLDLQPPYRVDPAFIGPLSLSPVFDREGALVR